MTNSELPPVGSISVAADTVGRIPLAQNVPRPKILVVDDAPVNLAAMRLLLDKSNAELVFATSGEQALAACLEHEFALILLDVQMPDLDGFEVASRLSADPRTAATPVIFVTGALTDDLNRQRGYNFGAFDYITKPINAGMLQARVKVFVELSRHRQHLHRLVAELDARNRQLEIQIAERERAEQDVHHRATHDFLTDLPNRALFMDRIELAMYRSMRKQTPIALLYIDLDGFKPVNDTLGHYAGDLILKQVAARLVDAMVGAESIARLGGDEFAVILESVENLESAVALAECLCDVIRQPYPITLTNGGSTTIEMGASIGVALYPDQCTDVSDRCECLIRAADAAMYRAKQSGKNRVVAAEARS